MDGAGALPEDRTKREGEMESKVGEIADGVYRISAYVPDIAVSRSSEGAVRKRLGSRDAVCEGSRLASVAGPPTARL
jgi:hypothetical protein